MGKDCDEEKKVLRLYNKVFVLRGTLKVKVRFKIKYKIISLQ
jgi:hypothetical protein